MLLSSADLLNDVAEAAYEDYGFVISIERIGEVKAYILANPKENGISSYQFWLEVEKKIFHLARRDGYFNGSVVE